MIDYFEAGKKLWHQGEGEAEGPILLQTKSVQR